MEFGVVLTILIVVFVLIVLFKAIRIVVEYKRLVVFRLGRSIGQRGPGVVFLIPVVDVANSVDLREIFIEIPEQTCITQDNAPIAIDFLIYLKVIDPVASVVHVKDFVGASKGVATTTLRAIVGDIPLDGVLAKREQINTLLRTKLDEVTARWGVKVTSVEIREITPPHEVQEAMNKQMAAERTRRALVLEADGKKQASITIAEGEKQSAILKAEGDRQAVILRAEAARQELSLKAEGYAMALEKIFGVAKGLDHNTMLIQYFEALKTIGTSPSTKYIFPMEFVNLIKPIVEKSEKAFNTTAK